MGLSLGSTKPADTNLPSSSGFGRDKENPLPSLGINKKPAPLTKVAPPAQRSSMGAAQVGADEAFDFSDEDQDSDIESSAQEEVKKVDFTKVNYRT
mmetsp:Transcript_19628/g.26535  ORF Transcript_19628/g.26535 Transcript_19628/m.26535 type:complete len:96 (-) Transcript_19628:477-764(-)